MTGFRQMQFPFLVDPSGRLQGVRMMDGTEVPFVFLTQDGQSLARADGQPFTPVIAPNIQKVAPVTGANVQMTDNALDGTLYINPAAALANLTITLPSDANSRLGQIRRIATNKAIASLTLTGAASIMNAVTSMSGGDCVQFQKIDSNTWFLIQ